MHFLYPTHFSNKTVLAAVLSAIFLHILAVMALFLLPAPQMVVPQKTVLQINFIQNQVAPSSEPEPKPEPTDTPKPAPKPKSEPKPLPPKPVEPTVPPKSQPKTQNTKPMPAPTPVPTVAPTPKVLAQTQPSSFAVQQQEQYQERLKQEQLKQEQARQEQLKQEQLKQEQARQEQLRQEQARQEQARQAQAVKEQAVQAQKEAAPLSVVLSAASWRTKPDLHFSAEEAAEFNPKARTVQASFWFDEKGKISQINISSTGDSRLDRQIKSRIARASLHPQKQNGVARAGQATATLELGLD